MIYCFVKEDLKILDSRDPLILQAKYAKHINKFIYCSLLDQKVYHSDLLKNKDEKVILRSTCDSLEDAIELLDRENIKLLENNNDLFAIENWDHYGLSKRKIFSISCIDMINRSYNKNIELFLYKNEIIFMKSRKKGFSMKVSAKRILNMDNELMNFLLLNLSENEEVMISEYFEISKDSLGKKESRHFVINGHILNSSRPVHTIKHNVPKSQVDYANQIVEIISCRLDFPNNFVLDIGEFEKNNIRFIDIVEINPITCSQCYVNNSIFNNMCKEIISLHNQMNMGYEYCLDAFKNPENYSLERLSTVNYEYINVGQYEFL